VGLPSPYGRFDHRRGQGKPSPYKFGCGSAALRYLLWTPMSARPFAVGGRLAVPSVSIAAEPRRVGQTLPLL